jgi:hypothetical protein
MMTEDISIRFTREGEKDEQIRPFATDIEISDSRSTPDTISGYFLSVSVDDIIQFELGLSPVRVICRGKNYRFVDLKRTGVFILRKAW